MRRGTASSELGLALARLRAARTHLSHARAGCTTTENVRERLHQRLVELADVEKWLCADVALAMDEEASRRARRST